eukprot:1141507-Pelagomonas_calceolata.AAC.1
MASILHASNGLADVDHPNSCASQMACLQQNARQSFLMFFLEGFICSVWVARIGLQPEALAIQLQVKDVRPASLTNLNFSTCHTQPSQMSHGLNHPAIYRSRNLTQSYATRSPLTNTVIIHK